jgi:hypothetical protein
MPSHWLNEPIAYRGLLLTDLKRFVEGFLLQLGPGSVFILERETRPGFLQLATVERHDKWLKVEFGLPDDQWSRNHFGLVHAAMQNAGYSNQVETNPGNKQIPRFLRVAVEGNRDELTLTLLHVLELAANKLEFEDNDRYTLRMVGEISSEYTYELASMLEQLPRAGRLGRMLSTWLRQLSHRYEKAKTDRHDDKSSKK